MRLFAIVSGPCTTSQGGRCVGRHYNERDPWPVSSGQHGGDNSGYGPLAEWCEIVVLGAGALGPSPLFDTVSYGPSNDGNNFGARHDAIGLGGASCAPTDCTGGTNGLSIGGDSRAGHSCYVSSFYQSLDPVAPTGCYAGASGPPPGTVLTAGETLTWAAAKDATSAYRTDDGYRGSASRRASAHSGWELCFAE
jgi:hypothetical protein